MRGCIAFRVDSSDRIGFGHVSRCLALAEGLRTEGFEIFFICKAHRDSNIGGIRGQGFNVFTISIDDAYCEQPLKHSSWLGGSMQRDAKATLAILDQLKIDLLVVDHYALDATWERALAPACGNVLVIDDLGDRQHHCSYLLDQNFGSSPEKYRGLVPHQCKLMLGPNYALLRGEFSTMRPDSLRSRTGRMVSHILISFGGTDPDNYTAKVLKLLDERRVPSHLKFRVLMSSMSPHLSNVLSLANDSSLQVEVLVDCSSVSEVMSSSDLAIGASGSTSWERCCLGLPTIQLVVADNQMEIARCLSEARAVRLSTIETVAEDFASLVVDNGAVRDLSFRSAKLCDGLGVSRVIKELLVG